MTERFTGRDGTGLAYSTVGTGPVLVCVPGGPGRAAAYLEDLGGLAAGRTLVMPDTRGTGASELPASGDYSAETLADDLDALREHLGLESMDLLGHSAGAVVAMVLAATRPQAVSRLVVVTSALARAEPAARERVRALRSAEPWYAGAAEAAEGMAYAGPGERARLERELRPFTYGAWGERQQAHAASADHQVAPRASSRFAVLTPPGELAAGLSSYQGKVLVVTGELDAMTPPEQGLAIAGLVADGTYAELAGAGHFPWVDVPGEFAALVDGFLAYPRDVRTSLLLRCRDGA